MGVQRVDTQNTPKPCMGHCGQGPTTANAIEVVFKNIKRYTTIHHVTQRRKQIQPITTSSNKVQDISNGSKQVPTMSQPLQTK